MDGPVPCSGERLAHVPAAGGAALEALRTGSGRPFARRMTSHVALGLEFFIGATILNLALNPTWAAAQMAVLTIVVRELVTLSFDRLVRRGV